jgi:hypothetical protein
VTGLAIGTLIYFDVGYFTGATADACQMQNVDCLIEEVLW